MTVFAQVMAGCGWRGPIGELVAVLSGSGSTSYLKGWGCPECGLVVCRTTDRVFIDSDPSERIQCRDRLQDP